MSSSALSNLPPAIFLMGPTASGKTAVTVELANALSVEIISVDSALIYRDMNIGTAKPDMATLARAPHHLIDIIDPTESYSAAAFRHDALRLMEAATRKGRIPLLVGGTMLYFKALRHGLSDLPKADLETRAELEAEAKKLGWPAMHAKLAEIDPETAERLKPNDSQRIQRALEIYRVSGTPLSRLIANGTGETLPYRVIPIALVPSDRSHLHARIAARFAVMLKEGLIEELRSLQVKYALHPDLPSMRCVGYRQAWEYLAGEITKAELLDKGIAATRQLAKRQLTWLRSMPENIELDCLAHDLSTRMLEAIKARL